MKTRYFFIAFAVIAVVASVAFVARSTKSQIPAVADPQPVAVTEPAPTKASCAVQTGATFAFSYQTQTHYTVRAQLPGTTETVPQVGQSELSGTLSFEVLSVEGQVATLLGRLSQTSAQTKEKVGDAVEQSFLARLNERCEVTGYARLKETPMATARVQQVALSDLSFSVGDGTAVTETTFFTGLGTLRALSFRGNEGLGHFVRRPLNYVARWSERMAGVDFTSGQVDIQRGGSSWFETVRGLEEVSGGQVDASKTEWTVTAKPFAPDALKAGSRNVEDYVWEDVLQLDDQPERSALGSPSEDHEKRVAAARGLTYDQAVSRFSVLVNAGANINEQWRDMAAFLDAHPEEIGEFAELITDEDFPAGGKASAFLALGQAQAPQAREALAGLYRNRELRVGDRIRSSLALAGRPDVGAPLAKELRAEAMRTPTDPGEAAVSRQSLLHLGVLSGTRPAQKEVVQQAMEVVQTLTASARTEDDYSVLCGMVGNMAELSLLPQIEAWTHLQDPMLRKKVPQAIRRYRVERVHGLVVEWLARERDFDVKRELFNVLHHMYVDAQKPIDAALKREAILHLKEAPLPLTRQSLCHLLAPHVGDPEVHALFKQQLKIELEEKSGLYSLLASYLPAESVFQVLATVPGLQHQMGGALKPGDSVERPAVAVPEESIPPMPPEMEAVMGGQQ